jgi:hypothetical protein
MGAWKKVLTFVLVIAVLSVLFTAPRGLQPVQAGAGDGGTTIFLPVISNRLPTLIPDSTNILTGESNQYLVSISTDTIQLVFSQTTPELDRVGPGEVIVSGIAPTAPNGYLRKVLTKEVINGQVVLTTGPATLEEAIEQASLSFTHDFSLADIAEMNALPGVTLAAQGPVAPNVSVVSLQLDKVLLGGNLVASGSLNLDMSMDFDFSISFFSLKTMRMVLIATETTALQLTSTAEAAGNEEYEIGRFRLTPMNVFVGSFPIVIQPTIVVMLGVDGSVSAALTTGVTQQVTLSGGVQYEDGTLSPVKGFNNNFNYQEPSISAQMTVTAYASAGLELAFYTATPLVPELELDLRIGPRLQADQNLCWLLEGTLEVGLHAELKFIKWELDEFDTTLVSLATPLVYAQKCTLLEVYTYSHRLGAYSRADIQDLLHGVSDNQENFLQLDNFEATTAVTAVDTNTTATAGGISANTTASGFVKYDTVTNAYGIPSFNSGTVTFDTSWNYNPNAVNYSIVSGLAQAAFAVYIVPHVDGVFTFTLSSTGQRSDARGAQDGFLLWGTTGPTPYPDRYDLPLNTSTVYTRSVTANSSNSIQFVAAGIDFTEDASIDSPQPSSGTARTTFQWTFVPAGSP